MRKLLSTEVGAVPASYSVGLDVVAERDGLRLVFTQYGHNHAGKTQVIPMAAGGLIPWSAILEQIDQIKPERHALPASQPKLNVRDLLMEEEVRD